MIRPCRTDSGGGGNTLSIEISDSQLELIRALPVCLPGSHVVRALPDPGIFHVGPATRGRLRRWDADENPVKSRFRNLGRAIGRGHARRLLPLLAQTIGGAPSGPPGKAVVRCFIDLSGPDRPAIGFLRLTGRELSILVLASESQKPLPPETLRRLAQLDLFVGELLAQASPLGRLLRRLSRFRPRAPGRA